MKRFLIVVSDYLLSDGVAAEVGSCQSDVYCLGGPHWDHQTTFPDRIVCGLLPVRMVFVISATVSGANRAL